MIDSMLFCKALKFAAHAAGKKDVRYYINGVRLEIVGNTMSVIGTDGARVAVCAVRLDPTLPGDAAITIPNDDVKRVLSTFGKDKGQVVLSIAKPDQPNGVPVLSCNAGDVQLQIKGVEGIYPDIRRVVPPLNREKGGMPNLNAKYLAEACNALEPLTGAYKETRPLTFDSTGKPGDVVAIRPSYIGDAFITDLLVVIAPIRY